MQIAVDKWHLVALANTMVTEVRQRVTRTLLGRRGIIHDPIWMNRRQSSQRVPGSRGARSTPSSPRPGISSLTRTPAW
ncbi:MAG TPA: hypothetical protein VE462_02470 [Propionibacteriaceae bacterium]|nr:hypothetical protein [Propionibacteriaceae bacterium]